MKHVAGARGVDDFLRRNLQRRHVLDGPAFIVKQHALCAAGDGADPAAFRLEPVERFGFGQLQLFA